MQGVMEWGKTITPSVYLTNCDDDVICVLVYILIYAVFFRYAFYTHQIVYLNCVNLCKYLYISVLNNIYLNAGQVFFF